jgi:hypothetical protein
VLVCRAATANHLCVEFVGLQCITSYRRIKQQNGLLSAVNRKRDIEKEKSKRERETTRKKEIIEFGNTSVVPV